ncbi:MAG: DUF2293 domain-containing protein [Planctomycetaceae bacterium]|nr:DUF2293 domain-containing protein [Planctomycetaceae bacterium]
MSQSSSTLRERVVTAAERALKQGGSVGSLELLQELGFLYPGHVNDWRKGVLHYTPIEPHIQCGAAKLAEVYRVFAEWAAAKGMQTVEAEYSRRGVGGVEALQVTVDGDDERERFFRTHYASAELSEKKTERLQQKLTKAPDLVVFITVADDAKCSECGIEITPGELLFLEQQQPLCVGCSDLDHLVFLPAGDTAMTRRAKKHSPLSAVVVKFNRSRKRYERQGLLVTSEALAQAEDECIADADQRAARREVAAGQRVVLDQRLVEQMSAAILNEFPHCPPGEARQIAAHAAERGSGRVGRSAAGRELDPKAITLAVIAHVRHVHTNYDSLLMRGVDRRDAREQIRGTLDKVLSRWRGE